MTMILGSEAEKSIRLAWLPRVERRLRVDIGLALLFALLWWGAAMLLQPTYAVNVLTDQTDIFMPAARSLANPYAVNSFFNPPWAAALLSPFGILPLPLAALGQLALYFVLLTLIIHKFGGGRAAVIIALSSFVAFNSAIELNVEWMVCIGLLVPRRYSLPFLVIKPQTALGYLLAFSWRDLVRAVLYALAFGVVALLLWGHTLPDLLARMQAGSGLSGASYNAAPMDLLGVPLALGFGVVLAFIAFRRRDPVLSILAGIFFMPYLALYGLLLHLALVAVRAPRAALVISLVTWVLFGGMLGIHLWNVLPR